MIKVSCLGMHYPNKVLFDNVILNIPTGQFIGIVGESGVGKSNFLYILSSLKRPTNGEVFINNYNILKFSPKEQLHFRQQYFGFIFQEHFLINYLTVKENILLPVRKVNSELLSRFEYLVEFLNIKGILDQFPHSISVGQKQRVSIARALINNPEFIFADEPTASLDEENSEKVISLLKKYQSKHNVTIIMVTHDNSLRKYFDKSIEIKNKVAYELPKEE